MGENILNNIVTFKTKQDSDQEARQEYNDNIKKNFEELLQMAKDEKIKGYTVVMISSDNTIVTEAMYDDSFFTLLGALNVFTDSMNVFESRRFLGGEEDIG